MERRPSAKLRAEKAAVQGHLWDVAEQPEPEEEVPSPPQNITDHITDLLGQTPISIDELVRQSGRDMAAVQMALLDLELEGRLERHAGSRISLIG
jgi:DNA processing protein